MKTRDFASKYIVFSKTSPITGPFRLEMYPMLGKPMDAADDISVKRLVIFKSSSALGTVLGQVINAKRIAIDVGDQIMVCQTDDHADKWTKTRGKEWLESIPDVMRLLKSDKYSQTLELWLFRHKFLAVMGPSITNAQSDQVRYVQTDESHLLTYPQGRLLEFEKRMGARWDRQSTHITTAPDEGREVDTFYCDASQDEWHWRCPKCNELIWALWEDRAKKLYNGERIFHWTEFQSEKATLDSVFAVCPHCQHVSVDTSRDRYALVKDGDYVSMNPTAPPQLKSFRWSVWGAAHWITWSEMLGEYLAAIRAVRMGDLKPHEDFTKKRECFQYRPELPDLGDGKGSSDYKLGDVWITSEQPLRDCSFDVQDEGGFHLWAQCDEWQPNGDSRRVNYSKLLSWDEARAFQQHHAVLDKDTYMDAGHRMREVFGICAKYHWYALFAEDADEFVNEVIDPKTKERSMIRYPYTKPVLEDSMSGKRNTGQINAVRGQIPPGFCLSRRWSKPTLGGYLMALKSGQAGRYYGIARNILPDYVAQLNSYTFAKKYDKTYGTTEVILKQVKTQDHSFATSSMCLLGAVLRGYYPLSTPQPVTEEKAA